MRAVVITGASTGIGAAAADRLAREGFQVFAGVRTAGDGERLAALGHTPLTLDVTDAGTVAAAAVQVSEATGGAGIAGLVNNAGIAVPGPVEHVDLDGLRRQLEVNVIGPVAVIQAFMAMLRVGRGRIVNVSSIGGRIALPLNGPYSASKYALEAISDSLRRELRGQGIEVSLIEPGGVKTEIWRKAEADADALEESLPASAEAHYGGLMRAVRREVRIISGHTGLDPEIVADAIARAMTARRPRTRYLVGRDARTRWAVAKRLPDRAFDALVARSLR